MIKFKLDKYTYMFSDSGELTVDRHGEPWRNESCDNAILALMEEVDRLSKDNDRLLSAANGIVKGINNNSHHCEHGYDLLEDIKDELNDLEGVK